MANYSLVIGSKFQPFSFERYLQPLQIYGQAYKEQEDALADLATKASIWDGLTEGSVKAHDTYQAYAQALEDEASRLATEGLNPASRRAMLNMRSRYAKEITPIEIAFNRRRELAAEQRKLLAADSSLRFDNDYSTMSLDKLIENPDMSYVSLSGREIAARTSAIAAQYAKTIQNEPQYQKILNGQYWQAKIQQGYTPEQIIAEATGNSDAPVELKRIRQEIHDSIKDNGAYDADWANAFISQGMNSAIGTQQYSTINNGDYINAYQRQSLANDAARIQLARDEFKAKYEPDGHGGYKPREKTTTGSGSGSGTPRVATYNSVITQTGSGRTVGLKEGESFRGKRITIVPNGRSYILKFNGKVLGTYNPTSSTFTRGSDVTGSAFSNYFGGNYDAEYDDVRLRDLGAEIHNIASKEGGVYALNNYNFYFDPDNASNSNEDGSFTIEPLHRDMPTLNNLMGGQVFDPNN